MIVDWSIFETHAKEWTDYVKGLEEEIKTLRDGLEVRETVHVIYFQGDCNPKRLKEEIMKVVPERAFGYELRICVEEPRGLYKEQKAEEKTKGRERISSRSKE